MAKLTKPQKVNIDNWFERNPKKTIFFIIIFCMVSIEILFQVRYYYKSNNKFLWEAKHTVMQFSPYGILDYKPNDKVDNLPLETDNYGFIHNGYKQNISDHDYLIFLVGGSTVEGRGSSSNATTIAACLEKILNKEKKINFRVVNAGLCGAMSYQEMCRIDGKILPHFKPKLIIALDGRNDAYYAISFAQWMPNWILYYDQVSNDINADMNLDMGILVSLVRKYSAFAAYFHDLRKNFYYFSTHTQKTIPSDNRIKQATDCYIVNHVVIHERLKYLQIKYLVFLQPTLASFLKNNISNEEMDHINGFGKAYVNQEIFYSGLEKFYNAVSKRIPHHSFFRDLSAMFRDTPDKVYSDSCHYTDLGNYLIAARIADEILPYVNRPGIDPEVTP